MALLVVEQVERPGDIEGRLGENSAQRQAHLGEPAPAGVTEVEARLAVVGLPRRPAPVSGDPGRVGATVGDVAPVDDEHPGVLVEQLVRQPLVRGEQAVVVSSALAEGLPQRPHASRRPRPRPEQVQGHRRRVLARHLRREQPAQVHLGSRPLLTASEKRRELGVIGHQFLRL